MGIPRTEGTLPVNVHQVVKYGSEDFGMVATTIVFPAALFQKEEERPRITWMNADKIL